MSIQEGDPSSCGMPFHGRRLAITDSVSATGDRDGGRGMPGFIQIMEFDSSRIEEVEALSRRMQEERGDALLATKATVTEDRDRPGHYFVIVEFDSYEAAMKNSNDPVTGRYAEQMTALLAGPPIFHNLNVRSVMLGQ
jgi:quinol monooxygenase YgiN